MTTTLFDLDDDRALLVELRHGARAAVPVTFAAGWSFDFGYVNGIAIIAAIIGADAGAPARKLVIAWGAVAVLIQHGETVEPAFAPRRRRTDVHDVGILPGVPA